MKKIFSLTESILLIAEKLPLSIKNLLKRTIDLIVIIFDTLISPFVKILTFKNKKNFKKVCVRLDGLGDAIMFIDYINSNNKDETLYIVSSVQESFFKNLKNVKHFLVIDRLKFRINLFYRFKMILSLREINCDEVINPVFSKEILLQDTVVRFISAKMKIGLIGDLENSSAFFNKIGNKFYNKLIKIEHNKSIHDLNLNYEIIKLTTDSSLTNFESPKYLNTFFTNKKGGDYSDHVILTCGSSKNAKNLPEIYWYKIIRHILSKKCYKIILTGHSLGEKNLCNKIEEKFGDRIINLHGKTSINDIFNIANSCKMVITNDTFMVHVSHMLDCKTIIFKKTPIFYKRFIPYPTSFTSNNMKKIFQLDNALYDSFDEVLSSVDTLLES